MDLKSSKENNIFNFIICKSKIIISIIADDLRRFCFVFVISSVLAMLTISTLMLMRFVDDDGGYDDDDDDDNDDEQMSSLSTLY